MASKHAARKRRGDLIAHEKRELWHDPSNKPMQTGFGTCIFSKQRMYPFRGGLIANAEDLTIHMNISQRTKGKRMFCV